MTFDYWSGAEIGGLCIGLVLIVAFIVLLIFLCTRFRHYWFRRKHSKMQNNITDDLSTGSQNKFYTSVPYGQNVASAECWSNFPLGMTAPYWSPLYPPQYNPSDPEAIDNNAGSNLPYPTGFAVHNQAVESAINASHVSPLQRAPPIRESTQATAPTSAYHTRDLSMVNANAIRLYPQLVEKLARRPEEAGASTTDSSGNQSSMTTEKTTRQKLRSKVKKVARASQFTRFPSRRLSRKEGSKKNWSKRKSRVSNFGLESELYGDSQTCGTDRLHSIVKNDGSNADEFGSLDNDAFLNSLESAAFSSTETPTLPRSPDNTSVGQVRFLSTVQYDPDLGHLNLTYADLARRSRQSLHHPSQLYRPCTTFRFPTPGPPVSGWAHHFAQTLPTHDTTPRPHQLTAKKLSSKSDSVPLLLPPPSDAKELTSRRNCSVESSLTRRPNSRSPGVARFQSEPRKISRDPSVTNQPGLAHNPTLTGSLSTLESAFEANANPPSYCILNIQTDSGFQDHSLTRTSGRSGDATNVPSPTSFQSIASSGVITPVQSKVEPKPRLVTLCKEIRP